MSTSEHCEWFSNAIHTPYEHRSVKVPFLIDGNECSCNIHYLHWDRNTKKPGILLVHGSQANAHWWSFIAPLLLEKYQVVAVDLSGNGDSGWRQSYSIQVHAFEVFSVLKDSNFPTVIKPVIVAHSYGGLVSMFLAHDIKRSSYLGGLIVIDTPVRSEEMLRAWLPISRLKQKKALGRRPRMFKKIETLLKRFKLRPSQSCLNTFILNHVSFHGVRLWSENAASVVPDSNTDWSGYKGHVPDAKYTKYTKNSKPLVEDADVHRIHSEIQKYHASLGESTLYSWKFDPEIFAKTTWHTIVNTFGGVPELRTAVDHEAEIQVLSNILSSVRCKCCLYTGENSIFFNQENVAYEHVKQECERQGSCMFS